MVGTRDTPPDVQKGEFGLPVDGEAEFGAREPNEPLDEATAKKLGVECYEASTNWLNAGRRAKWNDSLRAFQSMHASGSKYLSNEYRYRTRLYRPKSRAMVRKSEAQTAAAFFSNEDVVSISAEDDDDQKHQASAEIMQQLLQYRLTKTIPWFLTLVGARQDCEVMGIAIGKAYWRFSERYSHTERRPHIDPMTGQPQTGEDGQPVFDDIDISKKEEDHPWVDLIPPENFRFDPGADWRNPIATSPYLIELIPMYMHDALAKVKSGEWLSVAESAMLASSDLDDDVTRRSREQGRVPGKDHDAWKPRQFDICWVRSNIVKYGGQDWHFYSLASAGELLTTPKPLKEVFLQGVRPYVCGFVVLETHKTYPASKVELVKDLQQATNDDWNLRFDNVKLALNPRQFIKAGQGIELTDVRSFMPGKVITTKNPKEDVVWDRPPEATQSSYLEQDRINLDFDDLVGNFGPSSMASAENPVVPETVGGMEHMAAPSVSLNEYELRIFAETFVEPLVRQLVKLEQAYETDPVILALAGQKAQLWEKYGINQITDELLNRELTVRVNVGMGAANPQAKLRNFSQGAQIIGQIFGPSAAMGANFSEVVKEVFGQLGYKDGQRFFQPNFDPRVAMLQQEVQKLQQKQKGGMDPNEAALKQQELVSKHQNEAERLTFDRQKMGADNQKSEMEFAIKMAELELEKVRLHLEAGEKLGLIEPPMPKAAGGTKASGGGGDNGELSSKLDRLGDTITEHLGNIAHHVTRHGKQLETGLLHVANHLTAPKKVVRDAKGNPIGFQRDHSMAAKDLGTALQRLHKPQRIERSLEGRLEGAR